ncbi:hypothetical protein N7G274_009519 [Stereocaulon virgatum]|uniref:NB-ARC domain-containing protein n=1 Tax=Stereocaulon virgatum TaxID=373712 RepID=A0ABR3ZX95_9LECA
MTAMTAANSTASFSGSNHQGFQLGHNAGYVYNTINVAQAPLPSTATHNYDFGVRLGDASQIDENHFIGRDCELEQLQTWLTPSPGRQNIVALYGMGGMGKTQLGIHMIRRSASRYSSVYWLNAKDENTLKAGLAALAMEVTEISASPVLTDVHEEERLVQQARQWLSQQGNDKWLIVYDNYDNPRLPGIDSATGYDIRTYFPSRAQGSILITTRSPRLTFAKQLRITKLQDIDQSLAILATRSGRKVDGDNSAERLALRLDGLPLALATAGAYISQSADSFDEYFKLYNHSWNDLSEHSSELVDYEERTLYSTWNVSYQHVKNQDPAAAELLKLMAYLDNQDLWYELFNKDKDVSNAPEWWIELQKSRARFNRAISILHNYSLLEVSIGKYSLHTCEHDWTLEYLNREFDNERYRMAIRCIAANVNWESEAEYWIKNRRVLPHARRFEHNRIKAAIDWNVIAPGDLHMLAYLYEQNDMSAETEKMYQRALDGYEKSWGPAHTSTLSTVNNLGNLYKNQGKLVEAEEMYRRALDGYEKAWGPDHTSTLSTVNNLGLLYADQGKLVEAEQMYRRALDGYEKAWGPDHTSTLSTVNNLGSLYKGQGKLVEAEEMYRRALDGYEKAWGPDHTSTLGTVNNLGLLYADQGKLVEAEEMYRRALGGKEKAWGPDHTSTLGTVNNLGRLYADQGKLVEAEEMYRRALDGKEKAWGPDHTSTLDTVNNLGLLYKDQGKLVEAEEMYRRALDGYEKAWGPDHTSTLGTVNNLGLLYADQGKLVEAEEMYRRALDGKEKAWGPDHTSTLDTVNNLGLLYAHQGKLVEAEEMYRRALDGYEKAWGPDHTSTLDTVNNLGSLYTDQGKLVEAEQMYRRALDGYEKAWGPDHTATLRTVNSLGVLYADQGKLVEAEEMYRRALDGKEKAWGPDHTSTLSTVNNLGNLYAHQGKLVEAAEMYRRALGPVLSIYTHCLSA